MSNGARISIANRAVCIPSPLYNLYIIQSRHYIDVPPADGSRDNAIAGRHEADGTNGTKFPVGSPAAALADLLAFVVVSRLRKTANAARKGVVVFFFCTESARNKFPSSSSLPFFSPFHFFHPTRAPGRGRIDSNGSRNVNGD